MPKWPFTSSRLIDRGRPARCRSAAKSTVALSCWALATLACGDDPAPPPQAVVWLALGAGQGAVCPSLDNFEFPTGARSIITTNGQGDRVPDGGDNLVTCSVSPVAGMADSYDVSFEFSSGSVGILVGAGRVSEAAGGTIDLDLQANVNLSQDGCTVTAREALAGAVWLDSLSCPNFKDPRSPEQTCTGTGGIILENCAR